jgi:hypothetical protein
MRSWAPFIGLVVVIIFCAASWFLAPKGENQTYVRRHPISPSKLQSPPSKPCLRTKTSLEQLLAFHGKKKQCSRRVRFDSGTKPGHFPYRQSQHTFHTQSRGHFLSQSQILVPDTPPRYIFEKEDGRG